MNPHSDPANAEDAEGTYRIGGRVVAGIVFGALLLAGAGGWAGTAQLAGAVIAQGTVKVDRNLRTIQHRDGGIISDIAVREGDRVEKDQVLLRLDDAQTRAELSIVRSQMVEYSIRRARLIAERDGVASLVSPEMLVGESQHIERIRRGERRLLEGNLRNRASQKEQLAYGIEQLGEEIRGLEAQHAAKASEIALVTHEHAKFASLADKQLIEASRVNTSKRDLARLQGEKGEMEASMARARARISEINLQIIAIEESARTEAQRELSLIEPKLAELRERTTAIEDRLLRTDIRAPIAGTVNELSVNTVGGVISPAEKLVTIVPAGAELKVEARIAPVQIDQVRIGQEARLRFSAFNQRTTPELAGTVAYVSAATSVDPATGTPYYVALVAVPESEISKLGENALRPGMPLEVFISTEQRTAFSYISKPLTDQFSRALRER